MVRWKSADLEQKSKAIEISDFSEYTLYLKRQKENILCTMDDVRGEVSRLLHGTIPDAVALKKGHLLEERICSAGLLFKKMICSFAPLIYFSRKKMTFFLEELIS